MAQENGNQYLTPEHLLYALVDADGGLIGTLLGRMGVDCNAVLSELDTAIDQLPKVSGGSGEVYASPETGKVITVEEHSIIGGLGEAVAGVLSEKCPTMMRRIGVNDEFGHSGPAWELLRQFGLCADHIAEVARDFVKK